MKFYTDDIGERATWTTYDNSSKSNASTTPFKLMSKSLNPMTRVCVFELWILPEDLLDSFGEVFGHRSRMHDLHDLEHVVNGDVAGVLDVLDLLAVALRFLEGFDDRCGGGGDGEGGEGGGRRTGAELM
ncbi:hypothetical protein U1Q18_012462 [Sarracenia purpurea var. burkii]